MLSSQKNIPQDGGMKQRLAATQWCEAWMPGIKNVVFLLLTQGCKNSNLAHLVPEGCDTRMYGMNIKH